MLEERATSADDGFGLLLELDGRVVGEVALVFRSPSVAELSWVVHPDVGGRGLATEATTALLDLGFGHYACHRIFAELDPRNTASMRLCERLGMRRESHRLSDFWSKGEWTDTYEYALLASEWAARKH
jgi:aminoglycoside 6'-N-acetyltransferase